MKGPIELARHTRRNFIALLDGLTLGQLNSIPPGFGNNIAWNFAHIVSAQQTICYLKGNETPHLPPDLVRKYQKGSAPEAFIGQEELDFFKDRALSLLDALEADLEAGLFRNFEAFTTVFGVTLSDISDGIMYFMSHDNLHYGYAQALRRAVLSSESTISSYAVTGGLGAEAKPQA